MIWDCYNNPKFARMINKTEHPLVISDAVLGDLLSLSHSLNSNIQLLVRPSALLAILTLNLPILLIYLTFHQVLVMSFCINPGPPKPG